MNVSPERAMLIGNYRLPDRTGFRPERHWPID